MFVRKFVIALVLLLLTAAPVVSFAADGGQARFTLLSATTVAGTEVPAGKYDVQWIPGGEILFKLVGKPTKYSVQGNIEELDAKLRDNAMGIARDAEGKSVIKKIEIKGKKSVRITFE